MHDARHDSTRSTDEVDCMAPIWEGTTFLWGDPLLLLPFIVFIKSQEEIVEGGNP